MKRLSVFLIIVLLLGLTISASADNYTEHYIAECGMSIEIPSDYYVLTRNTTADDPVLNYFGVTLDEVKQMFYDNNIVFDAFTEDLSTEIMVTLIPTETDYNFNDLTDEELKSLAKSSVSDFKEDGINVEEYSVYKNSEIKFMLLDVDTIVDDELRYGRQYHTGLDNKYIGIMISTSNEPLSDGQKALIKKVVDSADFDSISSGGSGEATNAGSAASAQRSSDSNLMTIFFILLGVAALVLLAYFFLRKSSQKNRSYVSSEIYNQPFDSTVDSGEYPKSIPSAGSLPSTENLPAHGDRVENKAIEAEAEPVGYIFCPQCNERLKSDAMFCPFCGTKLSDPDFEDEYEPTIRAD